MLSIKISLLLTSGKLAALRMLVVHGDAFAIAAVPGAVEAGTHPSVLYDASVILFGTRALLRLYSTHLFFDFVPIFYSYLLSYRSYADIPLSASVGKTLLQRLDESAGRMRLPILPISAVILNSGGAGYSAPLAVRIGANVSEELQRLLQCTEEFEGDFGDCCLIGEVCAAKKITDKGKSSTVTSPISSSSVQCPPTTFNMCVAQGWLCRHRPRVIWDR